MEQMPLNNPVSIPRLHQCFICQKWVLEKIMHPVEVPSQGTEYVKKLICPGCLKAIVGEEEWGADGLE